jgi:hypothetical protein
MTAGMIQGVAAAITVVLVYRGNRWAPHAAIVVGFLSALGFSAAHLLPTWGAFSDSFINAAPAAGVTWFSWVTAIAEVGADLLFAVVSVAVLVARSAPRPPKDGTARRTRADAEGATPA